MLLSPQGREKKTPTKKYLDRKAGKREEILLRLVIQDMVKRSLLVILSNGLHNCVCVIVRIQKNDV